MRADFRKSLWASAADALGFIIGGIAGRYFGRAIGYDFFADESSRMDSHSIVGLVLILVGTGLGRALFRWLFARLGKI